MLNYLSFSSIILSCLAFSARIVFYYYSFSTISAFVFFNNFAEIDCSLYSMKFCSIFYLVVIIVSLVIPRSSDSKKSQRSSNMLTWPMESQYFEKDARNTKEWCSPEVIGIAGIASLKTFATTYFTLAMLESLSNILKIL